VPVTGASYPPFLFRLIYRLVFRFWGFGVFLFSNSFFNYLSQKSSNVVAGADPIMSSEAQGGLPQALTTR
jgi:hypothetical protein